MLLRSAGAQIAFPLHHRVLPQTRSCHGSLLIDFTFTRVQGVANILFGGTGFFIDTFSCTHSEGILWLHGYGNVFEVQLGAGEQLDIEPGGWIYKDRTVRMETEFQRLTTGLLASAAQLAWNRFTGPGRVGLQSMYLHLATGE